MGDLKSLLCSNGPVNNRGVGGKRARHIPVDQNLCLDSDLLSF